LLGWRITDVLLNDLSISHLRLVGPDLDIMNLICRSLLKKPLFQLYSSYTVLSLSPAKKPGPRTLMPAILVYYLMTQCIVAMEDLEKGKGD
jgi:hypothetical protein